MKKSIIINLLLALVMAPLGIEAKKKAKTVEVPQLINYPSAELGEYRLHGGNVVIQGRIVAPEELKGEKVPKEVLDKINGRFTVIMRDYIVGKEKTSVIDEHIHITRSEWGYLQEKFQFTGIPFVVIYDKDGNRREDKTVQQLLEETK